jgi:hypothetical protein
MSMMRLGHAGYLDATKRILEVAEKLTAAVRSTPGLFVLGDPVAMVIAFGSKDFNIYALAEEMDKRGFGLSPCQSPACVHLCVTLRHEPVIDAMCAALKEVAAELLANPEMGQNIKVALYGSTSSQSGASSATAGEGGPGEAAGGGAVDPRAKGMRNYMSKTLDMPGPFKRKKAKAAAAQLQATSKL